MSGFAVEIGATRRSAASIDFRLDVRFETPPGITVVWGPSGAGKSSLLTAILGEWRPESGRITVAGRALFDAQRGLDEPVHRRHVGMVFQHGALFPHMSVAQNVRFGAVDDGSPGSTDRLLERVGAQAWREALPSELSGGQRQRVALARALAARPRALLLDEPFSALDRAARSTLSGLLLELQRDTGIPFLHVTHDLAEALLLGDHVILLDGGRVSGEGPPGRVLADHALADDNLFVATVRRHREEAGLSEIEIGPTRLFCGLVGHLPGTRAVFSLPSREPILAVTEPGPTSARNVLAGRIAALEPSDRSLRVIVETPHPLAITVTPAAATELGLGVGRNVYLLIKASALRCLT